MKIKHKLYISIHRHSFLIPYTHTHNAPPNTTAHHTHITHAINSRIIHTHHIHYLHITHMHTHATHMTHIMGTHIHHTHTFIPFDIIYYTWRGIYITNSYHISTYIITHIPSHIPPCRRCFQGKRIPLHLKKDPGKQKQRMKWARIQVT